MNWLRFFTDVDHPAIPGMKKQIEMYFRVDEVGVVEDVFEQGTGKSGVKFAIIQAGAILNVVVLMGYTARTVVDAITQSGFQEAYGDQNGSYRPEVIEVARADDAKKKDA